MGDNLTGEGEGDDEQIMIDLSKVPANIERIAFTVTIYDAEARRQNFGQVSNSYIRLVDESNEVELIHYDLGEDFSCLLYTSPGRCQKETPGGSSGSSGGNQTGF